MGELRRAKDGHYYERRRSYGGRFYTVQRDPEGEARWNRQLASGCLVVVAGFLLLFFGAVISRQVERKQLAEQGSGAEIPAKPSGFRRNAARRQLARNQLPRRRVEYWQEEAHKTCRSSWPSGLGTEPWFCAKKCDELQACDITLPQWQAWKRVLSSRIKRWARSL